MTNVQLNERLNSGTVISNFAWPLVSIRSPDAEEIVTGVGWISMPFINLLGIMLMVAPVSTTKFRDFVPNLAETSRSGEPVGTFSTRRFSLTVPVRKIWS